MLTQRQIAGGAVTRLEEPVTGNRKCFTVSSLSSVQGKQSLPGFPASGCVRRPASRQEENNSEMIVSDCSGVFASVSYKHACYSTLSEFLLSLAKQKNSSDLHKRWLTHFAAFQRSHATFFPLFVAFIMLAVA